MTRRKDSESSSRPVRSGHIQNRPPRAGRDPALLLAYEGIDLPRKPLADLTLEDLEAMRRRAEAQEKAARAAAKRAKAAITAAITARKRILRP